MKAVVCLGFDEPLADGLRDAPVRAVGDGEVLIRVRAAGVNFADSLMVKGRYQVRPELPFVPGLEAAGEVTHVGANVTHLQPGDRVVAYTRRGGAFAEELVVTAATVAPIPQSMDFVTAAGFLIAYGTADYALGQRAQLAAGETVLITGATGGVGLAAVELGKALGARVIAAVGSAEKCAIALAHGADDVIDCSRENLRERVKALTDGRGVDVVLDPVGGDLFDACVRSVGWQGRVLVIGYASGGIPKVATNLLLLRNAALIGVVWGAHTDRSPGSTRAQLARLFELYTAGRLKPLVSKTYPLAQAATALRMLVERRAVGKVVLTV